MRIAVLDDEPAELERIRNALDGWVLPNGETLFLLCERDGAAIQREIKKETFDALILDWQVPGLSGFQLLNWVQLHVSPAPPVLMLTGRNAEPDVVAALNAGASDYVFKPFRPKELVARLNSVLRRFRPMGGGTPWLQQFHNVSFNLREEIALLDDVPVELTNREFRLALLLFSNMNRPVSRGYIHEHIWQREEKHSTRSLDTHIYRIRTKLKLNAANGWLLTTIYGYGYRLSAAVEE